MNERVTYEALPNGYVLVRDRASGLQGLWHRDGRPKHGDLTYTISASWIGNEVQVRYGS